MIKSSKKITKRLRKFEDGGMAGKGPLKPKTPEELAQETVSRLATIPGVSKTETPSVVGKSPLQPVVKTAVAPKAKFLPGGFKDQAQKDAYIKNTKNLLKTKSVADLVKMKYGTAAGLAALGFKDEVKKVTPVSKAPATNSKTILTKKSPIATYKAPSKTNLTPAELKKKGQELKQKGIGQKRAGQLFKQMAKPRESFAKRYGLPEAPKEVGQVLDVAMALATPAGRAKGATNLYKMGSALFKRGAKSKAGAEAIKKSVEVTKKGTEAYKKGFDVLGKTAKTAKSNRSLINRAQKGGLDKILRKGEGGASKSKDIIREASKTAKNNRSTIDKTQKGGIDKLLRSREKVTKTRDVVSKASNATKSKRASINKTQKGGIDKLLKFGEGK